MKITHVKFKSSVRIGNREFTFVDCKKDKIDFELFENSIDCVGEKSSVCIPMANIASYNTDNSEETQPKKKG